MFIYKFCCIWVVWKELNMVCAPVMINFNNGLYHSIGLLLHSLVTVYFLQQSLDFRLAIIMRE